MKIHTHKPTHNTSFFHLTRALCILLALLLHSCVIDPQRLFPPETTKPNFSQTCYDQCLKKGGDTKSCKLSCTSTDDPTKDCYDPCIKQGTQPQICGDKCYNKLEPKVECLLTCIKGGLNNKDCEVRVQVFSKCTGLGSTAKECLQKCLPDQITECYNPCTKTKNTPELCKTKTTTFATCIKAGTPFSQCQKPCTEP